MAFQNKDLRVGDLLVTESGELYIYLGFYVGRPWSMYRRPEYGYLYLFCSNWSFLKTAAYYGVVADSVRAVEANGGTLPPNVVNAILNRNIGRLKDGIDGNAKYTKSYVQFSRRVGHVDIFDKDVCLQYAFKLRRLGDKKPRDFKG